MLRENAQSALECGSGAAALESKPGGGSGRYRTPGRLRRWHYQSRMGSE